MYSPMPIYSYSKESRPKAANNSVSLTPEVGLPSTVSSPTASVYQIQHGIDDLLEPAIEGPPSPERIRALSNMMKRGSIADKHRSELTTSSGSSSRLSTTSDKPSWNQSLESLSLSRNPSQRSASSGVPSRERPDSVQFFGKAIFNRKGKLRREGSDHSGSNSSLDISEAPADGATATLKDQPFIQSVFARRRALRGEAVAPAQKKLQISGPYNFQHLTHTPKDSVPNLNQTNRMELVSEFSSMRPRRPTDASLISPQFASMASETFYHQEDPSAGLNANATQSQRDTLPPPPPPPPMRFAKRSQSQDKIRVPPPRPPRSPVESGFTSPIPPPPRTSSRVSVRHDRFGSLSGMTIERPATVTGFRKPQPFTPTSPQGLRLTPTSTSHILPVAELDQEITEEPHSPPRAVASTDDAAWPLPNNLSPLPDVPEEEEHHAVTRPSRMSVASNHSSLRGSVSVPLLRQLSLSQSPQRPPSNASDTLGRFDLFTSRRVADVVARDERETDDGSPDNWEDDIDYCYEHEAEADCDYAWERPSCDMSREEEDEGSQTTADETETVITLGGLSAGLLSTGIADVPALSPASQVSHVTSHEAITPTNPAIPVTSNFSLPRRDSSAQLLRVHTRNQSPERNFKESQGFSLSPSLLIPNDYHQQMLQQEREELLDDSDDEDFLIQGATLNDEPIMKFGTSLKPSHARSSASTTDSAYSEQSITSSRHKSTTSNSTAYTRWTGSSTSSWQARDSTQPASLKPSCTDGYPLLVSPTTVATPVQQDEAMDLRQDLNREKHSRTQSHADLLMKELPKTRRRARTTSRSHASPQFALFPSVALPPGGRI
ncbi:hypothetical protein F5Y04DRAFT_89998 [Hypomontagnella monticulosa]|nr:hypothetical protein F5Y04DRAFT_89998 [Hypomontagnella monticulosa]